MRLLCRANVVPCSPFTCPAGQYLQVRPQHYRQLQPHRLQLGHLQQRLLGMVDVSTVLAWCFDLAISLGISLRQ